MFIQISKIKEFFTDLLFPKFCFSCGKEGSYICDDCQSFLDVLEYQHCLCNTPKIIINNNGKCAKCQSRKINGLFFAVSYQNKIVQKLIHQFKYKPFTKDLAKPLSDLIITHFHILGKTLNFENFILIPIPLHKSKIKQRGFNQSEEIAKELSRSLQLPLISDVLIKTKETTPQMKLLEKQRRENLKGVFACKKIEKIKDRKIFLIDDVYTTGATMEECAKVLKQSKAKEVWGITVARG